MRAMVPALPGGALQALPPLPRMQAWLLPSPWPSFALSAPGACLPFPRAVEFLLVEGADFGPEDQGDAGVVGPDEERDQAGEGAVDRFVVRQAGQVPGEEPLGGFPEQ